MTTIDDDDRCPEWKLDVFVSFRGEELRNNFASHLFRALNNAGIESYRDDDEREIGEKLNPKLFDAIQRSRVSLALFSPRYGESRWCLNELVEMLEFHEKHKHHGHKFMPVFYRVRAKDVRKQTGEFGRFFEEYCEEICADGDESQVEKWKTALKEAGSTTGWRLDEGNEAEFIDKIVDHISNDILRSRSPCVPEDIVPIKSQVEEVISLLEMSSGQCDAQVRVLGIHGNRGTGKTTLAGMVYASVGSQFEGFSFLQLDDEANRDNLVDLQRKLLLDVFNVKLSQAYDLMSNANEIKRKLRLRKLLLVLDNVTSKDQLRHFGVDDRCRGLSRGSRIIITTRHRHVLDDLCVDEKYEVKKMCRGDSLRLFSRCVFRSDHPKEGFEELCESIVNISNVRPSDLVDLASVLSTMVKERWSEEIEKWKKKRKVFCRDLVQKVLSKRPIPCSNGSGFDVGRTAFLSKTIHDFLDVNDSRNGFVSLLIGHPDGNIFMIPLPNLRGVVDIPSETWVLPSYGIELAEKAEQQNNRSNAMQTWIWMLTQMGIVEPQREAARLTWRRTKEASPSRFTEDVGDQTKEVPNSLCFQEDKPAIDHLLQSKEVLEESIWTQAVNPEYIPRVYARDDEAAGPSSNHDQQITTLARQMSSDEEEDEGEVPEYFPQLRGYGSSIRESSTPLPSMSFLLSKISQAGFQISLGFDKRFRDHQTTTTSHLRHGGNLQKDELASRENRERDVAQRCR